MATITSRKTSTGEMRHRVSIRLKKDGVIVHQESKTFGNKQTAKEWARLREAELEKPGALERQKHKGKTLGDALDDLLTDTRDKFARTRNTSMEFVLRQPLAERDLLSITSADIIQHCTQRTQQGVSGATVLNDLFAIRAAFKHAKHAMAIPVVMDTVEDAVEYLRLNRVVHKPKARDRRPTAEELEMLDKFFREQWENGRVKVPMHLVMWFAIYSCRRLDEIASLNREDIDSTNQNYVVRDVKKNSGSSGNHLVAHMPEAGWKVLKDLVAELPGDTGPLLPISSKSVGANWIRACHMLGIQDLHFHDLRHEGTSRLGEDGYTVPQLQQVTLHRSWASLSIYVNMMRGRERRVDYAAAC